jgi:hypothetical protein
MQPFHLGQHVHFANLVDIGDDWSQARGALLEITQVGPGAAIARDLLISITIHADARKSTS